MKSIDRIVESVDYNSIKHIVEFVDYNSIKHIVEFVDYNSIKHIVEIRLKSLSVGKYSFIAIFDSYIEPKSIAQKNFIDYCKEWSNNEFNAGTERQEYLISKSGNVLDSYDKIIEYLESIDIKTGDKLSTEDIGSVKSALYDKHPENGSTYKYGSEWLYKELPKDFLYTITKLADAVVKEEEERKAGKLVFDIYNIKSKDYNKELVPLIEEIL